MLPHKDHYLPANIVQACFVEGAEVCHVLKVLSAGPPQVVLVAAHDTDLNT